MTNRQRRDANTDIMYVGSSGVGTVGDPFIDSVTLAANSGTDIGDVDVTSVAIPTALYYGKKVVTSATTDETLASTQAILSGVTIKAEASNTGIIYVGAEGVAAATGFELAAGEQLFLEIADLTTVWIDASVSGDGVTYVAT